MESTMQHPHNGVLLPDFLETQRVDDHVRDAYAAEAKRSNAALIASYFAAGLDQHGEWCLRDGCPNWPNCA